MAELLMQQSSLQGRRARARAAPRSSPLSLGGCPALQAFPASRHRSADILRNSAVGRGRNTNREMFQTF